MILRSKKELIYLKGIDGFHRDVIKFYNQNREVFWIFTYSRLKMTKK